MNSALICLDKMGCQVNICLISAQKHMLRVLIRNASVASNEYPQHMFSYRNKKKYQYILSDPSTFPPPNPELCCSDFSKKTTTKKQTKQMSGIIELPFIWRSKKINTYYLQNHIAGALNCCSICIFWREPSRNMFLTLPS